MAEKALSFAITPARVAFLLGLISLGGIGWTGAAVGAVAGGVVGNMKGKQAQ